MEEFEWIPVAKPDLQGNEEAYVVDAIRSSWISSSGKYLDRFEQEFAAACGAGGALGVSNGTVALHLALLALDVRPGDEVLVPSLTYVATANAVRYVGAEPVFVDVDPTSWCIDPTKVEAAITRRTKGIIPVHLYGHPADMDALNHLAAVHGLWVVEDAAEAPFARYRDRPVGGLASISTFSFYGNKVITSGEGGAVCASDPNLLTRLRTLRGQGVDPDRRYFFPVTGYNFRMTNVAAAFLCAQLERRTSLIAGRQRAYDAYTAAFENDDRLALQPSAPWAVPTPWLFCLLLRDGDTQRRDRLMSVLHARGIDTRPFFVPLHTLPPFRAESQDRREQLPVTTDLASRGMNLPTSTEMTDAELERVISAVFACLDGL